MVSNLELLTDELINKLIREIKKAKQETLIISPYVTKEAVMRIVPYCKDRKLILKLVTLPPGKEYVTGATDPDALLLLAQSGFSIMMLERLHAKIYIIDNETILLGSANLTSRGLGIIPESNEEVLLQTKTALADIESLKETFVDDSMEVSITESWLTKEARFVQVY